jgi:hypothetical protein
VDAEMKATKNVFAGIHDAVAKCTGETCAGGL